MKFKKKQTLESNQIVTNPHHNLSLILSAKVPTYILRIKPSVQPPIAIYYLPNIVLHLPYSIKKLSLLFQYFSQRYLDLYNVVYKSDNKFVPWAGCDVIPS